MREENNIIVAGQITEVKAEGISVISIMRKSTTIDSLIVRHMNCEKLEMGKQYEVHGKLRNKLVDGKSTLCICANDIREYEEDTNIVELDGHICKLGRLRTTSTGKQVTDIVLHNVTDQQDSYIPCVLWGSNAIMAEKFELGTSLYVQGRLQSREYRKYKEDRVNYTTHTTYELSVQEVKVND